MLSAIRRICTSHSQSSSSVVTVTTQTPSEVAAIAQTVDQLRSLKSQRDVLVQQQAQSARKIAELEESGKEIENELISRMKQKLDVYKTKQKLFKKSESQQEVQAAIDALSKAILYVSDGEKSKQYSDLADLTWKRAVSIERNKS